MLAGSWLEGVTHGQSSTACIKWLQCAQVERIVDAQAVHIIEVYPKGRPNSQRLLRHWCIRFSDPSSESSASGAWIIGTVTVLALTGSLRRARLSASCRCSPGRMCNPRVFIVLRSKMRMGGSSFKYTSISHRKLYESPGGNQVDGLPPAPSRKHQRASWLEKSRRDF